MPKRIGRIGRPFSSRTPLPPSSSRRRESSGWSNRSNRPARISNRTTIAVFDAAHRHPRQPVATLVDPRLAASNALLATEPVSVAALKDHSRSHVGGSGGWTVCMHVPDTEATTAALVRGALDRAAQGAVLARIAVHVGVRTAVRRPRSRRTACGRALRRARSGAPRGAGRARGRARSRRGDDPAWNAEAWQRVTRTLDALLG